MWVPLSLEATNSTNTFYIPVPFPCKLVAARYVQEQTQSGAKTCVISKTGGNTIISGAFSGTAGTITNGTVTSTAADANQKFAITDTITIAIEFATSAATAVMWLELDEFLHEV